MNNSNFEAYAPTNTDTLKKFFSQVSEGKLSYKPCYIVEDERQKGAGAGLGFSSPKAKKQFEGVIKRKVEESA